MQLIRHGDVLLRPVAAIPAGLVPVHGDEKEGVVLARGEGHGHRHTLPYGGALLYANTETGSAAPRYLQVTGDAALLQHLGLDGAPTGDHADVQVPAGNYEVIQQRQAEGETAVYRDD